MAQLHDDPRIVEALSATIAAGHAATISIDSHRPWLIEPLALRTQDGHLVLTYYNLGAGAPGDSGSFKQTSVFLITEVVDLGRSLDEIRQRDPDADADADADADVPTAVRPGRPRIHDEPRRDVYLRLPVSLVDGLDRAAGSGNRTAFIERLLRERLAPPADAEPPSDA